MPRRRNTSEKLELFRRLFTGRADAYGTYDPKTARVWQVKEPVTEAVLLAHLRGQQPYGLYLLGGDTTSALVIDFDDGNPDSAKQFAGAAQGSGLPAYIERSKSKGYHVWIFFAQAGASARTARAIARQLLASLGREDVEVFPKQDALDARTSYGNFINAPLFGLLVPAGRTVFVDPSQDMKPFPNQWDFLEHVKLADDAMLQGALQGEGGRDEAPAREPVATVPAPTSKRFMPRPSLPICAQRMLSEGVTDNQRVACFRLAIHFNRLGLPFDITVIALRAWAQKNRPTGVKRTITDAEVERQADSAYKKAYRGFGCDELAVRPFCASECPLSSRHTQADTASGPRMPEVGDA
ncbi:MAG: hypothetical protein HN742_26485 [Lentisphaerae bacterium]|jgi:hypothetical protein|nr:hypothetical protein [Lentisphaerota bacterium]MBT4820255.1 hypothetical protein [Lentisphaerota bacterium]MBT5606011.1 hypothetical protein [Lentisphaerota bacterium]MBT7058600.1 hypothetical protein [Lentisphaerota bacterium]MBT7845450.1 hypothetical protein [Lentisphaerota bacterium]